MSNGEEQPPPPDFDLADIQEPGPESGQDENQEYLQRTLSIADLLGITLAAAEKKALDSERRKAELEDFRQDIVQRKTYANRLFIMTVGWLVFIGLVISAHGSVGVAFELSDSVLIALITTSTATVIGIFLVVAKYLFYRP